MIHTCLPRFALPTVLSFLFALVCAQACFALAKPPTQASHARIVWSDTLDSAKGWRIIASTQVTGEIKQINTSKGKALCLRYNFNGVSGYVGMQRNAEIEYPDNYRFDLSLQGDAPANDLQLKWIDASGDNVWWFHRPKLALSKTWEALRIKRRQIVKAWGPSMDSKLLRSSKLELTIASAVGGTGRVCIDALSLRALGPDMTEPSIISARASPNNNSARAAFDQNQSTLWRSSLRLPARLQLDLGQLSEFGGLSLDWKEANHPSRYRIALSDDAKKWRTVHEVTDSNGGRDWIALPESEARFIAIEIPEQKLAHDYALQEVQVKPLEFAGTRNTWISNIAKDNARGAFPRPFLNEQRYWTLLAVPGDTEQGLLSEDGALEVARAGFSVEPFVRVDGKLLSWADVTHRQSLQDQRLPVASVDWAHANAALRVTAFAHGTKPASQLIARYQLRNPSSQTRDFELVLAVQPFQVNPPAQFLNITGGLSPIHDIRIEATSVQVNGANRLQFSAAPDVAFASSFTGGMATEHLSNNDLPKARVAKDASGLASGALIYRMRLAPQQSYELALFVPLHHQLWAKIDIAEAARLQQSTAQLWQSLLSGVRIQVPEHASMLADTLQTALAHQLMSKVGPRLQPGTRAYARSWIRDGAMISEGLLRTGHAQTVREYLEWYAPYQFANGKVPCCVDDRGSDPVPENDSHGQLIFAIAEYARFSHHDADGTNPDRQFLLQMWPHVRAAFSYMEQLRASERQLANKKLNPAFFGMMPASISHEGYSAKPMHSYWDNFWALRGYKDAVWIAQVLQQPELSEMLAARDQFQTDLLASIQAATQQHQINFLPGAAELGDFDPTSSTIAIAQAGAMDVLPEQLVRATFERYWQEFVARRDGTRVWKDYTPYEWRNVGALIRLNQRDRAWQVAQYFFADRAPLAWNQWAEVVSATPRKPFFLGDLPHAWVASDFVRAALDMFAYAREADGRLILAAGVPADWIAGAGVAINGLLTPAGKLSYTLSHDGRVLRLRFVANSTLPVQGAALPWPLVNYQAGRTRIDGRLAQWQAQELQIPAGSQLIEVTLKPLPRR